MTPLEFTAPTIEYGILMPLFIVFGGACLGVLIEAFMPRGSRYYAQVALTFAALFVATVVTIVNWARARVALAAMGSVTVDGPTYFLWFMLLVFTAISMLVFAERKLNGGVTAFAPQAAALPGTQAEEEAIAARVEHSEVFPLGMFALFGMMLFPASGDLITMFVALEILSLPLYLLSGLARRRRLISQEAAMKYFLLGSMSSAFFLFGAALLFGYAGSFSLGEIATAVGEQRNSTGLLLTALALIAVGLLFKLGAVPFHSWTPDVYTGAPTAVTAFMAVCTKIAAVGALLRVFYVALGAARWDWQPLLAVIAVLTMAVGSVLALTQTDIKRLLAYSSIAHAGFILTAVVGAAQLQSGVLAGQLTSVSAVLFYLLAYGFATIGAFAIVTMVRGSGGEATNLAGWAGLARKSPVLAAAMGFFLLSFAGIPLTGGFIGKWAVFVAAWRGGFAWLVVVAVVMSLVAAFFYLKVVVLMFFSDPAEDTEVVMPSVATWAAVGVGVVATVILGILPGPLMDLARTAGDFIR